MKTILVKVTPSYHIYLKENLALSSFLESYKNQKLFIITDDNVLKEYDAYLKKQFKEYKYHIISIKPGETSKNIHTYNDVTTNLLKLGMGKKDILIAFGGGVIGDLTGFIAGTIFRGVKFVQIPTSLLAMVDSSIGGKTGIDTPQGKNLIGVFKNPEMVLIDPMFLKTLPEIEYRNGFAEVIKSALIGDLPLFNDLDKLDIQEIIYRTILVKKNIVEQDPFESSLRMYLNFGHTFGHAIEHESGYLVKHGFAVMMGMEISLSLGVKLGITNPSILPKFETLLKQGKYNQAPKDLRVFIDQIKYDKKRDKEMVSFVFLKDIGKPIIKEIALGDLYEYTCQ